VPLSAYRTVYPLIISGASGEIRLQADNASFLQFNVTKRFLAPPSMRIGSDKHAHYNRTPVGAQRLLQHRNRFVRLAVGNQGEPQIPMFRVVAPQLPDGLVVTSCVKQYPAPCDARHSKQILSVSQRIKVAGTLGPCQGLVRPPLAHQPLRVSDVRTSIVRIQLQTPLEFRFRVAPLPLFLIHRCKQDVWCRKVRIQFNRFLGCAHHFRMRFLRGATDRN